MKRFRRVMFVLMSVLLLMSFIGCRAPLFIAKIQMNPDYIGIVCIHTSKKPSL